MIIGSQIRVCADIYSMTQLSGVYADTTGANVYIVTALLFALAGAFFLGIYFIHRIRRKKALRKLHLRAEAYRAAGGALKATRSS